MTELSPLAVSIAQAVTMTGMGRTWLYAAIKRQELQALKAGRRTLIEVAELHRFIRCLPTSDGSRNVE